MYLQSMNIVIIENGPVLTAKLYDEVLFFCGIQQCGKFKYGYEIPPEDREQLIEETKIHIEAHRYTDTHSPETILQNRGAMRLVRELNILFETSFLQTEIPHPFSLE